MITNTQFNTLAATLNDYSVSIYIPTSRVGSEQEDRLRLKNAIKKAREKLQSRYDLSEQDAEALLQPATELLEQAAFWKGQSDGLAVFVAEGRFEHYSCPVDFEPMIYVAPEFYLRPLIPVLGEESRFYFLALSKGAVKLFAATRYSITPIDLAGLVPVNMDAALLQDDPQSNLSRAGGAEGQRGSNSPVYFSRGGDPSNDVEDVKTYLDRVDKGIADYLCDEKVPLVLGGVEKLTATYREANTYHHLFEKAFVHGNLENDPPGMLHEKAWAVISPYFRTQDERDLKLYGDNLAAGEAGSELVAIVPAAINGRIAALWLDRNSYAYGRYEKETNDVEIMTDENKNATELYNLAAVSAFATGARVYNVTADQLPAGSAGACAIYRYAVDTAVTPPSN